MSNENINESIRFTYVSDWTENVISISICDEEIKKGLPVVTVAFNGSIEEIALQDISELISVFQSLLLKVSPFTDKENFERNKIVLQKTNSEKWIRMFERYHKISSEKTESIDME